MQGGIILAALVAIGAAHSFLTNPMPISTVETCRIGGNPGFEAFCDGPCPNYDFRVDMQPDNPSATWERGSFQTIHYAKNNHQGGFIRLALVPVDDMQRKDVHDLMAFYYGCWSAEQYSCSDRERHRDCGFDRDNLAWKTNFVVPKVYPDGVYVLGFTWYGGGEAFGSFGDYYDCAYIRIQGGPLEDSSAAVFQPGPRYHDGCQASVDRLGVCNTEPCGGQYFSSKKRPAEFANGAPMFYRDWFEQARHRPGNQIRVAESNRFGVTGFKIYDTGSETQIWADTNHFIGLNGIQGITIVPDYFGHIDFVEWVVNGKHENTYYGHPFAIAGSQPANSPTGQNFFDWHYPIFDKRVFVTAIAHSGGEKTYYSKDLYFHRH